MAAQIREDDIVTAFGVTDGPFDTAVATNGRSPYNATASGVIYIFYLLPSEDRVQKFNKLLPLVNAPF